MNSTAPSLTTAAGPVHEAPPPELRAVQHGGDAASARAATARDGSHWPEVWAALLSLSAAAATAGLFLGMGRGWFLIALCFGVGLLAAVFDAATARVPNAITYPAILVGLIVNALGLAFPRVAAAWLGTVGPTQALLGLLVFGGIGLVSWSLGHMGGGDMKLLAGVGALLGLSRGGDALLCALAVAVVYSVVNLLIRGRLNATMMAAAVLMLNILYLRDATPTTPLSRRKIPLSMPILIGLALSSVPLVRDGLAKL